MCLYFVLLLLCIKQEEEEDEEEAQFDWRQNIYQSEKAPCPSAYSSNHFKSRCDFIEEMVVEKVALMFVIGLKDSEPSAAFSRCLPSSPSLLFRQ